MVFPGTQTLPLFAAQARGFFERRGLCGGRSLRRTPRSSGRAWPLAATLIVHGAADQCIGAAGGERGIAIIVAGGDNGFNHLFVQPDIERIEDLRGRTLVADVANTGWSFVLYDILKRHGLNRGDYRIHEAGAPFRRFEVMRADRTMGAAILNPPFAIHARRAGLKDTGAVVDTIRLTSSRHGALCASAVGACQCGDACRLSGRRHRRPALGARSGQCRRGDQAHGRAPERAGRHRGGNPHGCIRPGN